MPDYNPNEVAKVKHLLSLAQSINDKIDGVTVTPVVKSTPTLSIGSWSKADTVYSAAISYNGDGTLSTNLGSISGTTLTVTDDDGTFSGTLTATAGTSYAATTLSFSHDTEEHSSGSSSSSSGKGTLTFTNTPLYIIKGQSGTTTMSYTGTVTGTVTYPKTAYSFRNDGTEGSLDVSIYGNTITVATTDSTAAGEYTVCTQENVFFDPARFTVTVIATITPTQGSGDNS